MEQIRCRSGYSFRTAVGTLDEVAQRLVATGCQYGAITDRGGTWAFVRWTKLCEKHGLKPIYGVELAVTDNPEAKKSTVDHWTFIALDSLQPLHALVLQATQQFYFEPRLTLQQALAATDVIRLVGRRSPLRAIPPQPNLYVALAPSLAPGYMRLAAECGLPFAAASDNFYPLVADQGFYEALCGRNARTQTWPQYILDKDEWHGAMFSKGVDNSILGAAIENADTMLRMPTAAIPRANILRPQRVATLRQLCECNALALGVDLTQAEYAARLTHELKLIIEKGFEDYFYIVSDMVAWARERMCVGPARGSSAASLVCYLLRITTIDPIKHDLMFERFLDATRSPDDPPDIDIDLSDQKREIVFDYLKQKYGDAYVGRLGTVAYYQADSAMNEACAALGIPKWESEKVMQAIIRRLSGDARRGEGLREALYTTEPGKALLTKYPELAIAGRFEAHPRHYSTHAAGVLLTDKPIIEYVALDGRAGVVHCDLKDAESLGLLKIDALGLVQLSVFERCCELIGKPVQFLDSLPLDDQTAFDVLNKRHYGGIFQIKAETVTNVANNIKHFDHIEDLVALTALSRPGPLGGGATFAWIKRKNGDSGAERGTLHPAFAAFTEKTRGVIVYQEQIMAIASQVGNLSWDDVNKIRKAMGKSLGKEYFDQFGDTFKTNAIAKGIPADVVNAQWERMCSYGANVFNRGHAVAYAIVSYWCCYLKAHWPVEFAAATLQGESDPMAQIALLRELHGEGIGYVPVHAELSTDTWRVGIVEGERKLIGPLTTVKGIGPKLVAACLSAKARGEPIPERAQKLLASPTTAIDSLWPIRDGVAKLLPDPAARSIYTPPQTIAQVFEAPLGTEVVVLCVFNRLNRRDENEAVNVAKRNGARITDGYTTSLNIRLLDDTGNILGKVNRHAYDRLGAELIERGKLNKAVYAVKGKVWGNSDFRGIGIDAVRYIGDMS